MNNKINVNTLNELMTAYLSNEDTGVVIVDKIAEHTEEDNISVSFVKDSDLLYVSYVSVGCEYDMPNALPLPPRTEAEEVLNDVFSDILLDRSQMLQHIKNIILQEHSKIEGV